MPKQIKLLYLFLFSIPVMAMLFLAQWNYLQADDYMCHWLREGHGFWGMQKWIYFNNTGRYTSAFLAALASEKDIIFNAPWLFPVLLIIAEVMTVFFLCKNLGMKDNIFTLTLAFLIFLIHINILPEPATAIYWFSGAATYHVSFILFILLAASVHRLVHSGTMGSLLAASLLILLIGGTNEMSAFLVNLSSIAITWHLHQSGRLKKNSALIITSAASLSLLALLFSPGIRLRRSYMPEPEFLITLPATFAWALYSIWEIFSEPAFWLAAAMVFYFSNAGTVRLSLKPRLLILLALIQLASLAIILFSTHGSIPLRMLNIYTTFNALLLLLLVAWMGNSFSPLFMHENTRFLRISAPITAAIVLFSGLSGSLFQSFLSAPFAKTVQQQWIDTIAGASSKGEKYVALPSGQESMNSLVDRSQLKTVMKDLARKPPSLLHFNYSKSNEITFYHLIVRNNMDSVRVGNELFGRPEWAAPASR